MLESFFALSPAAVARIRGHTRRTIAGMARYVERSGEDGRLELADLADLRAYCYVVAGIVGELLTDLFLLGRPALQAVAPALCQRSPIFGEGLQLVNILKDSAADAREGRRYLPPRVERSEVMALARRDLAEAEATSSTSSAPAPSAGSSPSTPSPSTSRTAPSTGWPRPVREPSSTAARSSPSCSA